MAHQPTRYIRSYAVPELPHLVRWSARFPLWNLDAGDSAGIPRLPADQVSSLPRLRRVRQWHPGLAVHAVCGFGGRPHAAQEADALHAVCDAHTGIFPGVPDVYRRHTTMAHPDPGVSARNRQYLRLTGAPGLGGSAG